MENNNWIYVFPWDKDRKNIENIKFPGDILKLITDTLKASFKSIPQFTPEKIYQTFQENNNTIIEWKYLFSNYAFYFWERLFNSRFNYVIEGKENLEKLAELNKNKIWSIIISPHDSSIFESVLYGLSLHQFNTDLMDNTYSVPRLWLSTSKLSWYAILMVKNIITLSAKDSHKYNEYKRFIATKSVNSILEKSATGSNIHMFPEWTKRIITERWMNPIVAGFVKLLNKKMDRKQVRVLTSHITDLTAWGPMDIFKKHTPTIHYWEPTDISYIFDNNVRNIPSDFAIRYKKANIVQGILELKKEFKKLKKNKASKYMESVVKEIDTDEKSIDYYYNKALDYNGMTLLPKHTMAWFQTLNHLPSDDILLQTWQVGRYIAENLPITDKGIYKLDSDLKKNGFEKDEKQL